jgi:imidazolonepropionase-like amidohydrolase
MNRITRIAVAALALVVALAPASVFAQETLVIRGGRVHTMAGPTIDNGVIVVRDGRIVAVGGADTEVPAGAEVVDATGMEVLPGFFDAVTRVGLTEIGQVDVTNDYSELGDNNPHLQAVTAVHPASEIIPVTRMTGITQIVAAPSGSGIAGQGSAVALDGWTVEEMLIDPSVYMVVQWPTLRTRGFDRATFTAFNRTFREAKEAYDEAIGNLETLLEEARRYDAANVGDDVLRRDLKLEALARVTRGELPMLVNVNDARGIRSAVEFGERNGVRIIIAGGDEAPEVAEMLADKQVPVILGPTQAMPPGPDDPYDYAYARPAKLYEAGVTFALSTFNASSARTLPFEIATAIPYGLPHEEALRAITINPARILGLDDRLGSIEAGKLANLAIVEGDPLEIDARVSQLVIGGRLVDPRDNKHDRLYERYRSRPMRDGQR